MKVLAIDTATERCSVALRVSGQVIARAVETPRGHAELILPMVRDVLAEAGMTLRQLDGIAYGRGPGAFTGVRIAIGVVQGLAFGAQLPTVGISNLAAVAQQVATPGAQILVCMDARMQEVYWSVFTVDAASSLVLPAGVEQVGPPETVDVTGLQLTVVAGTGFNAYPTLQLACEGVPMHAALLPSAVEIALLGEHQLTHGHGLPAASAQPVYLRNNVAIAKA